MNNELANAMQTRIDTINSLIAAWKSVIDSTELSAQHRLNIIGNSMEQYMKTI